MVGTKNKTISLYEEQFDALDDWKWKYHTSYSKIVQILINYGKKNLDIEKIIQDGLKNEKK